METSCGKWKLPVALSASKTLKKSTVLHGQAARANTVPSEFPAQGSGIQENLNKLGILLPRTGIFFGMEVLFWIV